MQSTTITSITITLDSTDYTTKLKEISVYYHNYIVLRSSGISQKSGALIVRYNQEKESISFGFSCFEKSSIAHNFGTTCPIQVGFSTKCTSPNNENFNQIEN